MEKTFNATAWLRWRFWKKDLTTISPGWYKISCGVQGVCVCVVLEDPQGPSQPYDSMFYL